MNNSNNRETNLRHFLKIELGNTDLESRSRIADTIRLSRVGHEFFLF